MHAPRDDDRAKRPRDLYRPNVGLALFHRQGLVFLGRRFGAEGPYQWQMPQGGVDRGETPRDAAFREMEEEIGVSAEHVDLLEETADWLYYEFPTDVARKHEAARPLYGAKAEMVRVPVQGT